MRPRGKAGPFSREGTGLLQPNGPSPPRCSAWNATTCFPLPGFHPLGRNIPGDSWGCTLGEGELGPLGSRAEGGDGGHGGLVGELFYTAFLMREISYPQNTGKCPTIITIPTSVGASYPGEAGDSREIACPAHFRL